MTSNISQIKMICPASNEEICIVSYSPSTSFTYSTQGKTEIICPYKYGRNFTYACNFKNPFLELRKYESDNAQVCIYFQ